MSGVYGAGGRPSGMRVRLGYFEDLTTLPVTQGIESMVKSAVIKRYGLDELRGAVMAGELDGALLPTVDALRVPSACVIPCSAIAAMGASRMYYLVSKRQLPTEINRVLIDMNDLGVEHFARLILGKKLMIRPEFVRSERPLDPRNYDLLQEDGFDAYVLVGRNAFYVRKQEFSFTLDLTQVWFELTRLPYVINTWVVRKGHNLGNLVKELGDVARRLEADTGFAARSAERLGIAESGVRQVYEKAFVTRFEPPVVQGIRMLAQMMVQDRVLAIPPVTLYAPPAAAAAALRKP